MLPSTGYFKAILCPFYEAGSCDRPYCHFKHLRRDESTSLSAAQRLHAESREKVGASAVASSSVVLSRNNDGIQNSVINFDANKILATPQAPGSANALQDNCSVLAVSTATTPLIISKPKPVIIGKHVGVPSCVTKPPPAVYNPTPISELRKRHIPVASYLPTRPSKVAVKRRAETDSPWDAMRDINFLQQSTNASATYQPTAITNPPKEPNSTNTYVPTSRSDNSSNSYDDGNSSDYVPKVKEAYYPKSKKRREEYVPKKIKAPLLSVHHIDDPTTNELEPEFDMMDEILTADTNRAIESNDENADLFEIEPKFSDDDDIDNVDEEEIIIETKEAQRTKVEGKENKDKIEVNHSHKSKSHEKSHKTDGHRKKSSNTSNDSNKKEMNSSDTISSIKKDEQIEKHKKKDSRDGKKESDRHKKHHSRSDKNHSKSDKNDEKSKSSTRDKHRSSSSSKDKDKDKDSHSSDGKKESSHRSKDSSKSHKDKVPSSKSDDSKSSRSKSKSDGKHSSSSSKSKRKSSRNSEKHSSHSSSRKSKTEDKKSRRREKSGSEVDNCTSPVESSLIDDALFDSSDSDFDVEKQCLKIFEEYEPSEHTKGVTTKEAKQETDESEDVGRKRVAHPSASTTIVRTPGLSQPVKKLPDPYQRMNQRWRSAQEAARAMEKEKEIPVSAPAEKIAVVTSGSLVSAVPAKSTPTPMPPKILPQLPKLAPTGSSMLIPQVNGNCRVRVAHVPYAKSLIEEKQKLVARAEKLKSVAAKIAIETKGTPAQTSKGGRKAHIPQVVPELVAPEPVDPQSKKFSLVLRQHYLNIMYGLCVQIYPNLEDAAARAVKEESLCHERCKVAPVYKNSCMLATHRLRKEVAQGPEALPSISGVTSHNAVITGKSKGSWSVEKSKKVVMDFKGSSLYERLKKWIMTEQQLRDNGYPRPHPDETKGRAKVYVTSTRNQSIISKVPNERYCCRCNKPYMVNKHGYPLRQENCIYHWGRKFTSRGESKYMCCQQFGFASGCSDGKNHVWEHTDYENLRGYVKTLPKDVSPEEQGVFALDCEMCYTTQGLELTRVTVINEDCNTIYETLVMPDNPILDYNTRFSGITEENMEGVTTTLLDVQATLLTMFSEHTILVGHSLESDFKVLKLIHDTVVDTSMMFPHKNGPPFKRALRNLCSEYLRKIIQNEVGGHDSTEDAVACMELVHWKVKEEAKLQ